MRRAADAAGDAASGVRAAHGREALAGIAGALPGAGAGPAGAALGEEFADRCASWSDAAGRYAQGLRAGATSYDHSDTTARVDLKSAGAGR